MDKLRKRILDSVHGYVSIPGLYMNDIIDTPQFQRLRRVEQTSCRALFPCARHDRFIHSIGVFHIGTLIVEHLWRDCFKDMNPDDGIIQIIITYRLACLLHDVGHTPFSHTFEEYFDNKNNALVKTLAELIPEDSQFEKDFISQFTSDGKLRFAPHEVISAIVALRYFGDVIKNPRNEWKSKRAKGIPSLLARMIVGCRFFDKNKSLEDAFIELLHSDIIDADGLDYVCRDVWASGYSTSKVDINRLIEAITIHKNDSGEYLVCYSDKALNDIKSVLHVKNFQNEFVFNHHTIELEQDILQHAMMSAAMYHMKVKIKKKDDIEDVRNRALKSLCNIKMYETEGFKLPSGELIKNPMDDDFIHLMKAVESDPYVKQWLGRQYELVPLWKRQESFLADLTDELREDLDEHAWIFSKACKKYLIENFDVPENEKVFLEIKPKNRLEKLNEAYIYTNEKPCKYTKIYPKIEKVQQPYVMYILIPKSRKGQRKQIQEQLLAEWAKHIRRKN